MSGPDLDATIRLLDDTGALLLDLEVAGWELIDVTPPDRQWREVVVSSNHVDGDVVVQSVLGGDNFYVFTARAKGVTYAQAMARRDAVLTIIEGWAWRLEVTIGGRREVWRATRSASTSAVDKVEAMHAQQTVQVRARVQPTPTVTNI